MPGGRECIDIFISMGLIERPVAIKFLSAESNVRVPEVCTGLLKKHPYFCRAFFRALGGPLKKTASN